MIRNNLENNTKVLIVSLISGQQQTFSGQVNSLCQVQSNRKKIMIKSTGYSVKTEEKLITNN